MRQRKVCAFTNHYRANHDLTICVLDDLYAVSGSYKKILFWCVVEWLIIADSLCDSPLAYGTKDGSGGVLSLVQYAVGGVTSAGSRELGQYGNTSGR